MRKSASVVIIGGGAIGCSTAYNLAKKGIKDVVLLERNYLTGGSTGRCGAGIRQQWGTELNCLIGRESTNILKNLNEELQYDRDIEFRQSGYLLIAYSETEAEQLKKNVQLQHGLGIPVQLLGPDEAREIVPILNNDGVVAATFCGEDGHINPFKLTEAYALAAQRLGVEVCLFTTVTGIETRGGRVTRVLTDKGEIETRAVVNATGPYAKFIGRLLGLDHPVEPERHQILITEPMEPMLGPMVMSFRHKTYCQQVPHGGFIMGLGNPYEPKGVNYRHDWMFLLEMARRITMQMPILREVRVVRQWAGHYGISPDGQPILGPVPEVEGYYLALGCGKGMMFSPIIGLLTAEILADETPSLPVERLSIQRFERGELIVEPAVV